jgi:general secretion pathway protein B
MPGTKKRPLWILLIFVVLLLNAAFLIWVSPWKSKKPQLADSKISSDKKNALQQAKNVNARNDVRKDIKEKPKALPETRITHKASSITPLTKEEASDVVSEAKPDDNHLPIPLPNKIYHMGELPQSIQQKLPAFAISTFLYSEDPGSRMVRINGQMMREGQYLSAGLKLEEIIQNGMIFSYQNYRFQVGLK